MNYSKEQSVKLMREISQTADISFKYTPLDIGTESKEGYGDTRTTWNFIKDKVDFTNQTVVNIGACCGFIANKLLAEGNAKEVVAIEINKQQCKVIRKIYDFNVGDSRLIVDCCDWMDCVLPQVDIKWIIVALNVIHDFREKLPDLNFKINGKDFRREALIKMFQLSFSVAIFELDPIDRDTVIELCPNCDIQDYRSPARSGRRLLIVNEKEVA